MENVFFSVIVPAFNASSTIARAIQSVLQQDYKNFEVLVVDDGSTDDTESVVKNLGPQVTYLKQANEGPSAARNKGATTAKGSYLVFLDSDDWLSEGYLSEFHGLLNGQEFKIGLGLIRWQTEAGKTVKLVRPWKKPDRFRHGMPGSFVISASLFSSLKGYDANLYYSENSDLFLRMRTIHGILMDQVVLSQRVGVIKEKFDTSKRRSRYLQKKYLSLQYFLRKHEKFFESSPKDYVNFKRSLAICALHNDRPREARRYLLDTVRKSPFSLRSYFQFGLFLFPKIAKLYYGR